MFVFALNSPYFVVKSRLFDFKGLLFHGVAVAMIKVSCGLPGVMDTGLKA